MRGEEERTSYNEAFKIAGQVGQVGQQGDKRWNRGDRWRDRGQVWGQGTGGGTGDRWRDRGQVGGQVRDRGTGGKTCGWDR